MSDPQWLCTKKQPYTIIGNKILPLVFLSTPLIEGNRLYFKENNKMIKKLEHNPKTNQ
jgi:hypothetical protein